MMKPIDNDVRATDLSGGRNGEFLRGGLWGEADTSARSR